MKAIWNGMVIAESDDIVLVETDYFFPLASVKPEYLRLSRTTAAAAASHSVITFNLQAGRLKCSDAVWYYDHPRYAPAGVFGRVAFRKEVRFEG
ncbi:MAG TPA: DUF427 domain-containing protein [Noviherbaspirillum sp.]|uniref:DUF427 domain-containing protein n=1 Tax=Noviherbaspirillum sp. TaxID=1926288 RepID=UPI002D5D5DFD|nr:DUF427 domain-containing protein [Noviherbaspirillum sp.]HYD95857.1 DUF427 domain-containing protein [Noviherbaspirillum sp.]